jgi:AcrR family transcriptional regulator
MSEAIRLPWIEAGYELFSKEGPKGLKIEAIARHVKKSKSSFYHHFSDLEIFTDELLHYHLQRAALIATRERACQRIVPDLLNVLIDSKIDLLFNRQLRVNRDIPAFKQCFEKSNKEASDALMNLWITELGLAGNQKLAGLLFMLVMDNFYLQISDKNLNYDWLLNYFSELGNMVVEMKKSEAVSY